MTPRPLKVEIAWIVAGALILWAARIVRRYVPNGDPNRMDTLIDLDAILRRMEEPFNPPV